MKKNFLIIFGAILCGAVISLILFNKIDKKIKLNESQDLVTVFQVGVYKNEVNAKAALKKYGGIIHVDNDYYRVYVAAYQNDVIIQKMKNYYDAKGIEYYLRKVKTDNEYIKTINKYEKLLQNSSDQSIYNNLNKLLIEQLESHI